MYTFGCFTALIGLIIARLKEPTSSIHMTTNEESWFGKLETLPIATSNTKNFNRCFDRK
jgi:hypothetical protein